jgi:hypothetical protein
MAKLSELYAYVEGARGQEGYVTLVSGFDASGDAFLLLQDAAHGDVTLIVSGGSDIVEQTFDQPLFLAGLSTGFGQAVQQMRSIRAKPEIAA